MYCKNCGKKLSEKAVVCPECGCVPLQGNNFCPECGQAVDRSLRGACPNCGASLQCISSSDWLTALLLAIFLGTLGIHRFYTGYTAIGIVQLLTLGGCGIWALIDIILIASGSYKDADGCLLQRR